MTLAESAAWYRENAAMCVAIAKRTSDAAKKLLLLYGAVLGRLRRKTNGAGRLRSPATPERTVINCASHEQDHHDRGQD